MRCADVVGGVELIVVEAGLREALPDVGEEENIGFEVEVVVVPDVGAVESCPVIFDELVFGGADVLVTEFAVKASIGGSCTSAKRSWASM